MVQAVEPGSYARPWDEDDPQVAIDAGTVPTCVVRLGDKRWPFWYGEVKSSQARKVRMVTGRSSDEWLRGSMLEVDTWAVVCWLARMQNGEPDLTLDEVESGLTNDAEFFVEPGTPADAEDDSPEA